MRITLGFLGVATAASLCVGLVGLRMGQTAAERTRSASRRVVAETAMLALGAPDGDRSAARTALRRMVALQPDGTRAFAWTTADGSGHGEVLADDGSERIPAWLPLVAPDVLADGVARSVDGPDGASAELVPWRSVDGAARGALAVVWTADPDGSDLTALWIVLASTMAAGAALWHRLGRPLSRIEAAVRGAFPARHLSEAADRIEAGLGGERMAARLERSVRVRTRELQRRIRHQDEVLSNTAHELRTPLTVIVASLEMLRDDDGSSPEGSRLLLQQAQAACEHLMFLIDDLVDQAAAEAGRLRLDVGIRSAVEILDEVERLVAPIAIAREIRLLVERPTEDLEVRTDPKRVLQVLFNLVGNALKYSPSGSTVVLRCRDTTAPARFEVLDEGIGVPRPQRDGLFQRFNRVHDPQSSSASGAGMGLHLCKLLVEAMEGRIGYQERDGGRGSIFWFELPRAGAAATVA